jgi:uncharacterized membrane protein YjfL (UPF0719 family)
LIFVAVVALLLQHWQQKNTRKNNAVAAVAIVASILSYSAPLLRKCEDIA